MLGAGPVGMLGAMAAHRERIPYVCVFTRAEGGPRSQLVESFGGVYLSAQSVAVEGCCPTDSTGSI